MSWTFSVLVLPVPKIPIISAKDFLRGLLLSGCVIVSVSGSHHKVRNPVNGKTSVVPIHGGKDLKKGLFPQILKQLDIDINAFIDIIKYSL